MRNDKGMTDQRRRRLISMSKLEFNVQRSFAPFPKRGAEIFIGLIHDGTQTTNFRFLRYSRCGFCALQLRLWRLLYGGRRRRWRWWWLRRRWRLLWRWRRLSRWCCLGLTRLALGILGIGILAIGILGILGIPVVVIVIIIVTVIIVVHLLINSSTIL